ncbi:MAG: hypothetical protein K2Y51_13035 [Gammaproteobacteria bacterium]|nr:hypothetical protein [Gammaproteobacteria bacterium]
MPTPSPATATRCDCCARCSASATSARTSTSCTTPNISRPSSPSIRAARCPAWSTATSCCATPPPSCSTSPGSTGRGPGGRMTSPSRPTSSSGSPSPRAGCSTACSPHARWWPSACRPMVCRSTSRARAWRVRVFAGGVHSRSSRSSLAPMTGWPCGRPTIADVAVFPYIALAPMGGIDLAPYPAVLAWIARVRALPGFIPIAGLDDPRYRG